MDSYSYDRRVASETLSPAEVSRLPVGSLVMPGRGGKPDVQGGLVVAPGGLLPISVLPEKASGHFPDDAMPVGQWGYPEFFLIQKGRGKLPTHGVAQRYAIAWHRDYLRGKMAGSQREALLPEGEEPVGESGEFSPMVISKLLMELGKLAMETSRNIRRPGEDPSYLLNQVFLPAARDKLFLIARKSKNPQLMTTLRRLMADDQKSSYDRTAITKDEEKLLLLTKQLERLEGKSRRFLERPDLDLADPKTRQEMRGIVQEIDKLKAERSKALDKLGR